MFSPFGKFLNSVRNIIRGKKEKVRKIEAHTAAACAPPRPPAPKGLISRRTVFETANFRFVECTRTIGFIWQAELHGFVGTGPKKTDAVASLRRAIAAAERRAAS